LSNEKRKEVNEKLKERIKHICGETIFNLMRRGVKAGH